MSTLSTHVLDSATGRPAAGMSVELEAAIILDAAEGRVWLSQGTGLTDHRLFNQPRLDQPRLDQRELDQPGQLPADLRHRRLVRRARPGVLLPGSDHHLHRQ
jgi:hypothetical protein